MVCPSVKVTRTRDDGLDFIVRTTLRGTGRFSVSDQEVTVSPDRRVSIGTPPTKVPATKHSSHRITSRRPRASRRLAVVNVCTVAATICAVESSRCACTIPTGARAGSTAVTVSAICSSSSPRWATITTRSPMFAARTARAAMMVDLPRPVAATTPTRRVSVAQASTTDSTASVW